MHLGIIPDGNRRFCAESGTKQSDLRGVLTEIVKSSLTDLVALWSGAADPALAAELAPLSDVKRFTVFLLSANNVDKRSDMSKEIALKMIDLMVNGVGGTDSLGILIGKALACFGGEVCVSVVGDRSLLPPDVEHKLTQMQRECKGARYFLTLAVGYDGDKDLHGNLTLDDVPPMDAVFRSGREKRLSGFFPRQTMHSELIFSDKLWPEIRLKDLAEAVTEFRSRTRCFGA